MPRNATPTRSASRPAPKSKAKPTRVKFKPGKSAPAKPTAKHTVRPSAKPASKKTPAKASAKVNVKSPGKPIGKLVGKGVSKSSPAIAKPPAPRTDTKSTKTASIATGRPDSGRIKAGTSDAPNSTKAPAKGADAPKDGGPPDGKTARKGITIVTPKPMKRSRPKIVTAPTPPGVGGLMSKLGPARKPLIASGPKAAHSVPLGSHRPQAHVEAPKPDLRTPYKKPELQKFKAILLRKRDELIGDINTMENEALKGESGSLSNLPQHIAEQGSETYEQSLALDLAAADRKLLKEIDEALRRIDNGTYGVCELTGKPIKPERLEELPWARYSIEAARELERRSIRA